VTAAKRLEDLIKRPWSSEEDERLRAVWPLKSSYIQNTMLGQFPGRTMKAIRGRANGLGLKRGLNIGNTGNVVSPVIERDGVKGKACIECLAWKPLEKFARHKTCACGRRNLCTTCESRIGYAKNPKGRLAITRRYQVRNPEVGRVHRLNSDAKRRVKMGPHRGKHGVTVGQLRAIREVFGDTCVYCGDPAKSLDHVIPLARGGEHVVENLVPACLPCNKSKKDKLLTEWAGPTHKEIT